MQSEDPKDGPPVEEKEEKPKIKTEKEEGEDALPPVYPPCLGQSLVNTLDICLDNYDSWGSLKQCPALTEPQMFVTDWRALSSGRPNLGAFGDDSDVTISELLHLLCVVCREDRLAGEPKPETQIHLALCFTPAEQESHQPSELMAAIEHFLSRKLDNDEPRNRAFFLHPVQQVHAGAPD